MHCWTVTRLLISVVTATRDPLNGTITHVNLIVAVYFNSRSPPDQEHTGDTMPTDNTAIRTLLSKDLMDLMIHVGLIAFVAILCVHINAKMEATR